MDGEVNRLGPVSDRERENSWKLGGDTSLGVILNLFVRDACVAMA